MLSEENLPLSVSPLSVPEPVSEKQSAGSRRFLDIHPEEAAGACMKNASLYASSSRTHVHQSQILSMCTLCTAVREGEALGSNTESVTYSLTNPGNESLLDLRPSVPDLL